MKNLHRLIKAPGLALTLVLRTQPNQRRWPVQIKCWKYSSKKYVPHGVTAAENANNNHGVINKLPNFGLLKDFRLLSSQAKMIQKHKPLQRQTVFSSSLNMNDSHLLLPTGTENA